jgi:DNA-binding SARP family transcriptional activator
MIRVLGPIDVQTSDGVVSIGSRNLRALLGALAMGVGHAVPVDHLEYVIWGDEPPDSVENTLQSYVSRLRHLLGPDTILSEDHSYQLEVGPDHIDAVRFERILLRAREQQGDPAQCHGLCGDALRLWRGHPFGDLGDEEPFRLDALRLDELRVAAMELSLEAELALGRHELIIGELESAVEEYPFREGFWYLLIDALARGDRRVEALRACGRLRDMWAEVGLDATDRLTSMEDRILRGAPVAGTIEEDIRS